MFKYKYSNEKRGQKGRVFCPVRMGKGALIIIVLSSVTRPSFMVRSQIQYKLLEKLTVLSDN